MLGKLGLQVGHELELRPVGESERPGRLKAEHHGRVRDGAGNQRR